jgi:hypothetical protein
MDGRYPFDFSTPVTLPDLMSYSESQLDRLLESYGIISHEQHSYGIQDRDFGLAGSGESLLHKLTLLLDFLGARQIAGVLRSDSGGNLLSSRQSLTGIFR